MVVSIDVALHGIGRAPVQRHWTNQRTLVAAVQHEQRQLGDLAIAVKLDPNGLRWFGKVGGASWRVTRNCEDFEPDGTAFHHLAIAKRTRR